MPEGYAVVNKKKIFLAFGCGMRHNLSMAIDRGDRVEATTASGERVLMRALGPPTRGRDFPIVWVCTEQEFSRYEEAGDEADGIPWPLAAVRELERA